MPAKFFLVVLALIGLAARSLGAQALPGYYSGNPFLMASPIAFQEGQVGFVHPANLALLHRGESRFYWTTDGRDATSFNDWGLFTGVPGLGFGMHRQHQGTYSFTDYRLGTGFGSSDFALGLSYGWSSGDAGALGRKRLLAAGTLLRPTRFLSLGLLGNFSLQSAAREGIAEIGVRPFATPRLLLFADLAVRQGQRLSAAPWSAGVALQVVTGLHLVGRRFSSEAFTLGMSLDFGSTGIAGQTHYDAGRAQEFNSYMVRAGSMRPSIFTARLDRKRRHLTVDLKGRVAYHKFVLFDQGTHRLFELLQDLRAAANDDRVAAVVVNLSSSSILPEHAWELREALAAARAAGKHVVVFLDQAGMTTYHLASVADRVVLDPEGMLMLEGYVLGRTYFKGTLDKLGLGFDEWRFFKYKSAAEAFSRDQMSDADREQHQDYVDDWYETVRDDICRSRGLAPARLDSLIDEEIIFMPQRALAAGLVDTLARWSAATEVVKATVNRSTRNIAARDLREYAEVPTAWGGRPRIALVYGLGECALDQGIKARWLEKEFLRLAKDRSVKAVIFRVDSPGGDGMASDLVAEAIKKCKEKKPVIVSQGQVAGSGGYWISMYGSAIVAAPATITGSIGVIGGWIYDQGFGAKLGMTSDHVQRGAHADLGMGVRLPLLGLQIPARNLTVEERGKMERLIRAYYDIFVRKVAAGRGLPEATVREIAEGHFYSGLAGKANGLVDEIGDLHDALALARQKAGLAPDEPVEIVEIPRYKGLINFEPRLVPMAIAMEKDPVWRYLKLASERPGQPLPMLLPGTYPTLP